MFKVVIDNAVLYTQPKGTIHISITQDASSYCLTIADSGIGMDEEDINLVRNRFYRSRTGQAVNPNGSGLGIPIAIDVAEKHGIEMLIESAIGKGTTVSFIGNKVALTMGDKTASSMGDKMASTIGDKVASTDGDRLASSIENEVVSSMGDKTASNTGDTAASSMGDKASSREV